jgi:hypothetical protein
VIKVVIDEVVSCTARHGVLCACSYRLHLTASSHGTCMRHMACCVILCWPGISVLGRRAFLMLCLTLLLSSALWRSRVPMTSLSAVIAVVLCILCVETYPDTRVEGLCALDACDHVPNYVSPHRHSEPYHVSSACNPASVFAIVILMQYACGSVLCVQCNDCRAPLPTLCA